MIVVNDYRGHRIEVDAVRVAPASTPTCLRRTLSDAKPIHQ